MLSCQAPPTTVHVASTIRFHQRFSLLVSNLFQYLTKHQSYVSGKPYYERIRQLCQLLTIAIVFLKVIVVDSPQECLVRSSQQCQLVGQQVEHLGVTLSTIECKDHKLVPLDPRM